MKKNCGCDKGGSTPAIPDYLMFATSPNSAATCGEGQTLGAATAACLLQEPTYDVSVGAYTIPAVNSSSPIQVCNGTLYTVGEWVQFVGDGSTLQVISIVGNGLQLSNRCPNTAPIKGNSNPGTVIPAGNPIVIVGEPACLTEEEALSELLSALANAKSLCMPALEAEASETSKMHLLGWRKEDPNNSDFQKCIQWLSGIWKTAKSLFIDPIEQAPAPGQTGVDSWRAMVIHKDTGEVRAQLNATENPDYQPSLSFVGVQEQLYKNYTGAMENVALWVNIPNDTPLTQTINLSIASINALQLPDDFYVAINVNVGIDQTSGYAHQAIVEINGSKKGLVGCAGGPDMNCISLIIPVSKEDKKIELKVTTQGSFLTPKCHVTVDLLGVYL